MSFTVGFDLDMTLIDPRAGLIALFDMLADETGYPLDGRGFVTRLGPPLRAEFARYGLHGAAADRLVDRYRELYGQVVIPVTTLLPGARAAVRGVVDRGGSVIVVSGKYTRHARGHCAAAQLPVSAVVGDVWSVAKAAALAEHGAEIYVGDHLGDVAGARAADALAIGVATGPITAAELAAAGADAVLRDLTEFPAWLDGYLSTTVH